MLSNFRHAAVAATKRIVFGRRGEPYKIPGHVLRYAPSTRPVRVHHVSSANNNVRYDAMQVQLFCSNLSEGDTAIDIGAHAGQYALIMAARCGASGNVVAFEPDPYARAQLERNLALNPGIKRPTVEVLALSDATGEGLLFSHGGNSQSSLARSGLGSATARGVEEFKVPLKRLDDYIEENGLPTPRWVKIDTEGAEIRILQGAPMLLRSGAGIVCELHPYAWREFGNSIAELRALAAVAGRRIRYMDEQTEIGDDPVYGTVLLERRP